MSWISVDIESDGPAPGLYSMIAIGAVLVDEYGDFLEGQGIHQPYQEHKDAFPKLYVPKKIGYLGHLKPEFDFWDPEALAVSGFSREETLEFPSAEVTMNQFRQWIVNNAEPPYVFVGDNPGFDFGFLSYYFTKYCKTNPFGWSGRRIGDLFSGLINNTRAGWKHLRMTPHTHDPLHDARGNAEALLYMRDVLEMKVKF